MRSIIRDINKLIQKATEIIVGSGIDRINFGSTFFGLRTFGIPILATTQKNYYSRFILSIKPIYNRLSDCDAGFAFNLHEITPFADRIIISNYIKLADTSEHHNFLIFQLINAYLSLAKERGHLLS